MLFLPTPPPNRLRVASVFFFIKFNTSSRTIWNCQTRITISSRKLSAHRGLRFVPDSVTMIAQVICQRVARGEQRRWLCQWRRRWQQLCVLACFLLWLRRTHVNLILLLQTLHNTCNTAQWDFNIFCGDFRNMVLITLMYSLKQQKCVKWMERGKVMYMLVCMSHVPKYLTVFDNMVYVHLRNKSFSMILVIVRCNLSLFPRSKELQIAPFCCVQNEHVRRW